MWLLRPWKGIKCFNSVTMKGFSERCLCFLHNIKYFSLHFFISAIKITIFWECILSSWLLVDQTSLHGIGKVAGVEDLGLTLESSRENRPGSAHRNPDVTLVFIHLILPRALSDKLLLFITPSQQDSCILSTKNSELSLSKSDGWLHTSRMGMTVTTDGVLLVPEVMVTNRQTVFYCPQLLLSHHLPGVKPFISILRLSAPEDGDWALY